jgi:AraC-like DNA-binding protein
MHWPPTMDPSAPLPEINLLLRAALATLLVLAAGLLWRDQGRALAARLGAACALGVAAYALVVLPVASPAAPPALWLAPVAALTTGNAVVFWLLARALFEDGFRLRAWHGLLWAALALAGLVACYALPPRQPAGRLLGSGILVATLGFSLLAVGQTLASWRADLVEGRRRLRVWIVAAGAAYTLLNTGLKLLQPAEGPLPPLLGVIDALGLALLVLPLVWRLLGSPRHELFAQPEAGGPDPAAATPAASASEPAPEVVAAADPLPVDAAEAGLLAALQRLMTEERVYREEGLTIGVLAERLGLPEHRLRRLINQQLGHRNFNQYLNGHRLAEAKAALADPARASLPVLTIAMDAGFQ